MADPVTWSVGVQTHTSKLNPSGAPTTGVNIPVELSTGERFDVFVDDATYRDTAVVAQMIADEAARHVAVANLYGQV